MIVLITGSRQYNDLKEFNHVLDEVHESEGIELIVQGGATGADRYGLLWARYKEIPCLNYPAKWKTAPENAGNTRNREMITPKELFGITIELVVAFPGGSGTMDMIAKARQANIEVYEVK